MLCSSSNSISKAIWAWLRLMWWYLISHAWDKIKYFLILSYVSISGNCDSTGLRRASFLDGENQDGDWYLACAANLRCLEACYSKETTEGQLLSAKLFSLLSMHALATCPWPTDPEQRLDQTSSSASLFGPTDAPPCSLGCPNMPFCKCLKCADKTFLCLFLPLWQKPDAGSWIDVTFDVFV